MAREIDEKIVQMRFENSDFEKGARETIKTLDNLNKSTEALGGNTAGMDDLLLAINKVNDQFSLMSVVARTALTNIATQAVNAGEKLVKNMTVDQVAEGWQKYGEKTRATKTIMNATGQSIDTVNDYLKKLMWFTDETSYNFTDMTSNIGKFNSSGVDLNTATNSMIGIANWAALAGQGANEASRAMYNLSQALGRGYVQWQDWMSIVNANMDTKEIKEQMIETAKAVGTLTAEGKNAKGELVTFGNFGETLRTGWLTTDVLNQTLSKYSDFTNEVYKLTQETGMSAAEAIEQLGAAYDGVGKKAFLAGQVSKTFADALDATADAASSRWMSIFEAMFGNLEQQEVFWTDVTSFMYDAFIGGLDSVVEALDEWAELGGSIKFLNALEMAMDGVVGVANIFGNAWEKAFGPLTADSLMRLTNGFEYLISAITPTETTLNAMSSVLGMFMSIIGTATSYVAAFAKGFEPLVLAINSFLGGGIALVGISADTVTAFSNWVRSEEALTKVTETVSFVVSGFVEVLKNLLGIVGLVGFALYDAFSQLTFSLKDGVGGFDGFVRVLKADFAEILDISGLKSFDLTSTFGDVGTFFVNLAHQIGGPVATIADAIQKFIEKVKLIGQNGSVDWSSLSVGEKAAKFLGVAFEEMGKFVDGSFDGLTRLSGVLSKTLGPLGTGIKEFIEYVVRRGKELSFKDIIDAFLVVNFGRVIEPFNTIANAFKNLVKSVADTLEIFGDTMKTFQTKLRADALQSVAKAIAILAASIFLLSKIPTDKLAVATTAIIALGAGLVGFMKLFDMISGDWEEDKFKNFSGAIKSFLPLTLAIMGLSMSVKKLASLDPTGVAIGVSAIGALMVELAGFVKLMDGLTLEKKSISSIVYVAIGVTTLVSTIKKIGELDLKTLAKGLIGVGVAIMELAAFAAIAGRTSGSVFGASTGMIALAAAMHIVIPAIKKFAEIPLETLGPGLLKFASALGVLVAAMIGLSFSGEQGAKAAVGLTALAAAFALLLPQMAVVAAFSWESVAKVISIFAGVLGTFTIAGLALAPVGPVFLTLAGGIAALNLSIAAIIVAISGLITSIPLAAAAVMLLATASEESLTKGLHNVELLLGGLIDVFVHLKAKWKTAVFEYFKAIIEVLAELAPDIVNGVMVILDEVLAILDEKLPGVLEKLDSLLAKMEPYVEKFAKHACEIATSFAKGFVDCLWDKAASTAESVGEWLDNVLFGGAGKARKVRMNAWYAEQGREITNGMIDAAGAGADTFAGEVQRNKDRITRSGANMGEYVLKGFDDKVGYNSPWDSLIDRMGSAVDGIKKGAEDGALSLGKVGEYIGEKLLGGFTETNVGDAMAENVDSTFSDGVEKSNAGGKASQKIAKQLKDDKSIEEVAQDKANAFAKAFEGAFSRIDSKISSVASKYGIAEAYIMPDDKARESKIAELQFAQLKEELKYLGEKYVAAYQKYQNVQRIPNLSKADIDKVYSEYLSTYEELAKKANEVVSAQQERTAGYAEAEELVRAELIDLERARHSILNNGQLVESEATKEAYQNYIKAVTNEQKQAYYSLWQQLRQADAEKIFGDIIAKPLDIDKVRADVYRQLGIDPNNPTESFVSVSDLINQVVAAAGGLYKESIVAQKDTVIQEYETQLAQSAKEVVEFVEENVAPEYLASGARMAEATAEGIEISASKVSYSGQRMTKEAARATREKESEWEEVGLGMMQGVARGIAEGRSEVISSAVEVATAAIRAAKQALGMSSPSREFLAIGMYAMDGLRIGIMEGEGGVKMEARSISTDLLSQFDDFNSRLERVLDDELHPEITPTLNLTGVRRAAKNLDSIWSASTLRTLSDISMSELDRRDELFRLRQPVRPSVTNNNNFTQNNYSPKALSDVEIYLQTKKELGWAFKGAVR